MKLHLPQVRKLAFIKEEKVHRKQNLCVTQELEKMHLVLFHAVCWNTNTDFYLSPVCDQASTF